MFKKINKIIEGVENIVILIIKKTVKLVRKLNNRRKKNKRLFKDLVFFAVAIIFIVVGGSLLWFSSIQVPDLASFDQRMIGQSSKIFDRTGTVLLYDLGQNMRRTIIPFDRYMF